MRVSIITVTYNSAKTIRCTLESINSQTYANIEHIIIDGNSTDDTLSILKDFPHIAKIISESDNGLYDAMNKGIALASGDVIGILNSDDMYSSCNVISDVVCMFEKQEVEAVYGDLQYVHENNLDKVMRTWKAGIFSKKKIYYGWMPPHPTFFVRQQIYKKTGSFNLTLKMSADYELMLRMFIKENIQAAYIPQVLVKMRTGGVSNASFKNRIKANKEDRKAWKLNNLTPYFFTLYLKPFRKILQYIIK
jgi:glycosyltransferase involved in cell wall biosynthesis